MVFVIQNAQNEDMREQHAKRDPVLVELRAQRGAHLDADLLGMSPVPLLEDVSAGN